MADGNACIGGVCPSGTPSWYQGGTVPATGRYSGYMTEAPEVFDPLYKWYNDPQYGISGAEGAKTAWGKFGVGRGAGAGGTFAYEPRIQDLQAIKEQFTGPEATYIRWMVDKKIDSLKYQYEKQRAGMGSLKKAQLINLGEQEQAAIDIGRDLAAKNRTDDYIREHGGIPPSQVEDYRGKVTSAFGTPAIGQERVEWAEGKVIRGVRPPEEDPMPIPDWMTEYIVYTTPETTRGREIPSLIPLGAQEKLDPEQLGQMAGFLAYSKAGAPERFSEKALTEMADISRWWQPYQAESMATHPKQTKLAPRWATARQR